MSHLMKLFHNRWAMVNAVTYWTGAAWSYRYLTRPSGAIILMYHSIASEPSAKYIDPPNRLKEAEFRKQMKFLSLHRKVVSMSSLIEQLLANSTPAAGTVCVTFDDGYLDNLTVAAPILEEYNLPATIYLPTAYIDRGETHWADVLHQYFSFRTNDHLYVKECGLTADLSITGHRDIAYKALHTPLLESAYDLRQKILADVERQLQPRYVAPRLTMNWDDVRKLSQNFPRFEIGGHSRNHLDLRTQTGEAAESEIFGCMDDIQRELGKRPKHFSFPYSRWQNTMLLAVERAGWNSALGDGPDFQIRSKTSRFVLPRVPTPQSVTQLKFMTSGAYPHIYRLIGK